MNAAARHLLTAMVFVSGLALAGCWAAKPKTEPKEEEIKADTPVESDPAPKKADPPRRHKEPAAAEIKPAVTTPEDPSIRLAHLRKHLDAVDERRGSIDEFVRARNSKDLLPALVDIQERLSQVQSIPSGNAKLDARIAEMLRVVFGMISSVKAGDWARAEERAESIHAYGSVCNKLLTDTIARVKTEGEPAPQP